MLQCYSFHIVAMQPLEGVELLEARLSLLQVSEGNPEEETPLVPRPMTVLPNLTR